MERAESENILNVISKGVRGSENGVDREGDSQERQEKTKERKGRRESG